MPILRSADYEAMDLNRRKRTGGHAPQSAQQSEFEAYMRLECEAAYEAGRADARAEFAEKLDKVAAILQHRVEEFMLGAATIVAESVAVAFGQMTSPEFGLRALEAAIHRMGLRPDVVVEVSSADATVFRALRAQADVTRLSYELREDPLLEAGEIVIDSLFGRIHVGALAQAEAIRNMLDAER